MTGGVLYLSKTETSFSKWRYNLNGKTKMKQMQMQSSDGVNSSDNNWSGDSRVICRRIKPVQQRTASAVEVEDNTGVVNRL